MSYIYMYYNIFMNIVCLIPCKSQLSQDSMWSTNSISRFATEMGGFVKSLSSSSMLILNITRELTKHALHTPAGRDRELPFSYKSPPWHRGVNGRRSGTMRWVNTAVSGAHSCGKALASFTVKTYCKNMDTWTVGRGWGGGGIQGAALTNSCLYYYCY